MKKFIVCQPTDDRNIDEILETWKKAKQYLESKECQAIYGFKAQQDWVLEQIGVKNKSLYMTGKFFEELSTCDGVYFTNGWALDKTCRIIRLATIIYNLEIMEENEKTN